MCFHKGLLVLHYALVVWTLYFSHFFTSFFIGLCRICLLAKVCNWAFIICSLLAGIDCVIDKLKAKFSWMKSMLFCPHFRALKLQNFWRHNVLSPPPPPQKKETNGTLLVKSVTLFKPAGCSNFYWNPWVHNNPGYYFFIVCFSAVVFPSPLPLFLTAKVVWLVFGCPVQGHIVWVTEMLSMWEMHCWHLHLFCSIL